MRLLYDLNPNYYFILKAAAILRHKLFNIYLEQGTGEIAGTWHERLIRQVYPK